MKKIIWTEPALEDVEGIKIRSGRACTKNLTRVRFLVQAKEKALMLFIQDCSDSDWILDGNLIVGKPS